MEGPTLVIVQVLAVVQAMITLTTSIMILIAAVTYVRRDRT